MNRKGGLEGLMVEKALAAASVKSFVILTYCLGRVSEDHQGKQIVDYLLRVNIILTRA